MAGRNGKKGICTPVERRPSRQDNGKEGKDNGKEIKDYESLLGGIRKEFKMNEQYIEKKLLESKNH